MIYLLLFLEFLKIGAFTFGGGYAMIPLVKETVLKHEWLSEGQFLNMIGMSEVTPGPIAINMATYVGSTQGGILGSLVATIGVVLPAFLIMLLIAILLKKYMKNKFVQSALGGIKSVAVALILSSAITIFADILLPYEFVDGAFKVTPQYISMIIFALIVGCYFLLKLIIKKKPGPIAVIIMSAVLGLAVNYIAELIL